MSVCRAGLLAGLFLLSGCQAHWTAAKAEDALGAGAFDEAAALYRAACELDPNPEVRAQLATAQQRAAAAHFATVERLREAGDLDPARREARLALYYSPDNAAYQRGYLELRKTRRGVREQVDAVRAATQRDDWLRAQRLLGPIRVYQRAFPELVTLEAQVVEALHRLYREEGRRYLRAHDYERGASYFERALKLRPGDAATQQDKARALAWAEARDLARAAAKLLEGGELSAALSKARAAARLHPESRHGGAVLREVLRRATLARLEAAARAESSGDRRLAYVELLAARELAAPQRTLVERIGAELQRASGELCARALARGAVLERQGLSGAAWLLYRAGEAMRPGFLGLRQHREQTGRQLDLRASYRVLVLPPREEQETAPGSGQRLAHHLRHELQAALGAGVTVYGPGDLRGTVLAATGLPPDAILGGTARKLTIETRTTSNHRSLEYTAGRVPELNNRVEELKASWQEAQADIPRLQRRLAEIEGQVRAAANRVNRGGNRTQVQQAQANYTVLLLAQGVAQGTLKKAHERAQRRLQAYLAEPPYQFLPLRRTYHYPELVVRAEVEGAALIELRDLTLGEVVESWQVTRTFTVTDTVTAAFPPGRLRGDPLRIESDGALLDRCARQMAKLALGKIVPRVAHHGRFPMEQARRAAARGDLPSELHWLAVAWHTGPRGLPADQRRTLRERVLELTGLDLETGQLTPAGLPQELLR